MPATWWSRPSKGWATAAATASAVGTALVLGFGAYQAIQGRLTVGTNMANGSYDLQFTLFDVSSGSSVGASAPHGSQLPSARGPSTTSTASAPAL